MATGIEKAVIDCKNYGFNAQEIARRIRWSQEACKVFGGFDGFLQEVEDCRNPNDAVTKFCDGWISLSNKATFKYVIEAAKIDNSVFAGYVAKQYLKYVSSDGSLDHIRASELVIKHEIPRIECERYFKREKEEDAFHKSVKNLCETDTTKALVVWGMGGVGKSTMVQQLLLDKKNDAYFSKECKILYIIWMDVRSQIEPYNEASFIDQLLDSFVDLGLIHDKGDFSENLAGLQKVITKCCSGQKMLLVLDDVVSVEMLKTVQDLNTSAYSLRCVALARDRDKLKYETFKEIFLPVLSQDEVHEMLMLTLRNRLSNQQIKKLAGLCYGLPIIAQLVQSRLSDGSVSDETEMNGEYQDLLNDLEGEDQISELTVCKMAYDEQSQRPIIKKVSMTLGRLLQSSFRHLNDKPLLEKYYRFLFFKKGSAVDLKNVSCLLCCKENEASNVCERLKRKSLLQRGAMLGASDSYYCVHDLMFDAALKNATSNGFGDSLEDVRNKLISAQVLQAALSSRRRMLLDVIINTTDANYLEKICVDQTAYNQRKTFFQILYETDWRLTLASIRHEKNISADILNRLLLRLFQNSANLTLSERRMKMAAFLFRADENDDSLLAIIHRNRNKDDTSEHQLLAVTVMLTFAGSQLLEKQIEDKLWQTEFEKYDKCPDEALYLSIIRKDSFETILPLITCNKNWLSKSFDTIWSLISHKKGLSKDFGSGHTLLEVASATNQVKVVELLLQNGAAVNKRASASGRTALSTAANYGFLEIVELLIKFKATVDLKDESPLLAFSDADMAVLEAASSQDLEAAMSRLIMGKEAFSQIEFSLEFCKDPYRGSSALIKAAKNGHLKVVRFLVEKGADATQKTESGRTALISAAEHGHFDVVELLMNLTVRPNNFITLILAALMDKFRMASGVLWLRQDRPDSLTDASCTTGKKNEAIVDDITNDGWTALMAASQNCHLDIVELLIKSRADVNKKSKVQSITALMLAAQTGHIDVVNLLLQQKADVKAQTTYGFTALHYASQNGHHEIVRQLIKYNREDIDKQTNSQCTALMLAAQNGHIKVVYLLISNHAQVNLTKSKGWTALMLASQNGHLEIAELLVNNNADVNIKSSDGATALYVAAQEGCLSIVEFLIRKGAEIDSADLSGRTALIQAAKNGHIEVVRLLIKHGAGVDVTTSSSDLHQTALMFATITGHVEVVKLLLENKADINKKNTVGCTAITIAAIFKHHEIEEMLVSALRKSNCA